MFCRRAAAGVLLLLLVSVLKVSVLKVSVLKVSVLKVSVLKLFADSGYRGTLLDWVVSVTGGHATLQIVKPAAGRVGFGVDPKRWIVERTISWLNWSRRLSKDYDKDYEQTTGSAEAWIDVSAIRCALRKLEPF